MDYDISDEEDEIPVEDEMPAEDVSDAELSESEEEEEDEVFNVHNPNLQKIVDHGLDMTSDILTIPEFVNLIGTRAVQIDNGGELTIDYKKKGLDDSLRIAIEELRQGKFPLNLQRPIGVNDRNQKIVEIIDPNTLALPLGIELVDF